MTVKDAAKDRPRPCRGGQLRSLFIKGDTRRPARLLLHGSDMGVQQFLAPLRKALIVVLALAAGATTIALVAAFIGEELQGSLGHIGFFGVWGWARFAIEHPAAEIYDHAAQQAFFQSLDPNFPPMPFPYPPLYLLIIRPLGWLPYPVALLVWIGVTLVAYLFAVCAPSWRPAVVLPAILAPATAFNLLSGQNGFLTVALLVGGVRLAPARPLAGGVLLGLLAYKPQFALLVVIALVAARWWRTAFAAAVTVVAAVAASLVTFGFEAWRRWVTSTPDFLSIVDLYRGHLVQITPTPFANALALGAPARLALAIQLAVTSIAAAGVWFAFREAGARGGNGSARAADDRAAVLATASILASPYAFAHDLPLAGAAVALFVSQRWKTLSTWEALALGAASLMPALQLLSLTPPLGAVGNGLLLALLLSGVAARLLDPRDRCVRSPARAVPASALRQSPGLSGGHAPASEPDRAASLRLVADADNGGPV